MKLHWQGINIFKIYGLWFKKKSDRYALSPPLPDQIWQDPRYFIAFGLGSGAMPIAPGTFGSLMALPFYYLIADLNIYLYGGLVLLFILASMWLCEQLSQEIQVNDHPSMCIDEFAGMFVTLCGISPTHFSLVFTGFLLFRLFDILKPWPISWIDQHIHGGIGMILDDVLAGAISCGILHGMAYLFG